MPWYASLWIFITDKATVLSTVVTMLCTFAIARFTWQLKEVSAEQGKLTERALAETRRAFVNVRGFYRWYELDAVTNTYSWRFQGIWENTGDTPTKNFRYGVHCAIRNTPLPPGFNFEANVAESGRGLLGAKVVQHGGISPVAPIQAAVTAFDLHDAQMLTKYIYFYGWARYNDIYEGTREHVVTFCYVAAPVGNPITFVPNDPQNPLSFSDLQHSEGNAAWDA